MAAGRHVIFGTAGHVDHGKSSLVLALTGTDPDRLAEEKAREMTIDLGFAFLDLPGFDEPVAIVDVPGHEMFVRNMVAGATGVDAAIFVVAADEGVMPQTVEHLDVLRHLNVTAGVIALTKCDKVAPEQLAQVTEDMRGLIAGTFLENAPMIPVSSVTREGLPQLRKELARLAASVQQRSAAGIFRLPIDRVFTLKGAGVVVTGTVVSGSLSVGDTVTCQPEGRNVRVRSLQMHNQTVERIAAGQRAAVNLADVAKEDLQRGDVLATPGALAPTLMVDTRIALSSRAPRPLEQRTRVRVHHGTEEVMARVVLLESDTLPAGQSAVAQLRLEAPLVAVAGDAFVLRSYSPMRVIGGGSIVDAHPPKRRKATDAQVVAERESLPLSEVIVEELDRAGARGVGFAELQVLCGLSGADLRAALEDAAGHKRAVAGRQDRWFSAGAVDEMRAGITSALARLHAAAPLRGFVSLNDLASAAAPASETRECLRLALESLESAGAVVASGKRLRLSTHAPQWVGRDAAARDKILAECLAAGLAAPTLHELAVASGLAEPDARRVLEALVDSGDLIALAPDILVHRDTMEQCRARVRQYLKGHREISIGQCRDLLKASRKYLLPLMERLDQEGLTIRRGDVRILRQAPRGTTPPDHGGD